MARRKISKSHIRTLGKKNPHSYFISIPRHLIDKLGWRAKQKLTVKGRGKGIIVQDWKKKGE